MLESVWAQDETGLALDCDEDRHFSLIIKNTGSLDLLISINFCGVMNLKVEAHSYSYLRMVFHSKQHSREYQKNLWMLVRGFKTLKIACALSANISQSSFVILT